MKIRFIEDNEIKSVDHSDLGDLAQEVLGGDVSTIFGLYDDYVPSRRQWDGVESMEETTRNNSSAIGRLMTILFAGGLIKEEDVQYILNLNAPE